LPAFHQESRSAVAIAENPAYGIVKSGNLPNAIFVATGKRLRNMPVDPNVLSRPG